MARVERYTQELAAGYAAAGYWTPEYPVDYWRLNARERGDATALVGPDARYSWAQAATAIERRVAALAADGWRRGDVLVLQAPNSAELMLLRLACEAAGIVAALVPVTFSRNEVDAIVAQLVPRGVALPAGARGAELLELYRGLEMRYTLGGQAHPGTRILRAASGDHAGSTSGFRPYGYAAVTTTSGTTGTPKCVEHTACARLAAGREYIRRLRLGPDDVICGFTSIFAGNCDLVVYHAAPQAGARIVLLDAFTPEAACALIAGERATGAVFVPTLLHRLLAFARLADYDLSSLRFVTSFGAMLAPETAAEAEERLGVRVIQGYGATEFGALASTAIDDPPQVRRRGVGRPLAGTEIEIRDGDGRVLPRGSVGRIHARGPYCVGGFVNDSRATQAAWADGFFALGDMGRIDDEGYLWLEGRARDIIIRGGQNIAPLEIEDALLGHPQVREAVALGMPDEEMGERVCVFVVPANGAAPDLDALRNFLLERGLARFKLPERLELVADLPMNPAGTKVNKRMLQSRLQSMSQNRGGNS